MNEDLRINSRIEKGIACFTLNGFINIETSDYLEDMILQISADNNCIKYIFDATGLEYVSSAGIRVFMDLYDKNKVSGGKIMFVNMKPEIKRVFELVGFMKYFIEAGSVEEAMKIGRE